MFDEKIPHAPFGKPNGAWGFLFGNISRYTITVSSILKRVCP